MIVQLNKDGLVMIPILHEDKDKVGGEEMVRLIPGYNEILDEVWLNVRNHVDYHLASGVIVEYGRKEKDEDGNDILVGTSIRRQTPSKAKEMVKNCFCLDTLDLWENGSDDYEMETRADIRVLIEKQRKNILNGGLKEA